MTEGFKKYVEKEKEITAVAEEKRLKKEKEDRVLEKERLRWLEINKKRDEKTLSLLEKYPEILKLQRYSDYLEQEARSMGCSVKKLRIVDQNGEPLRGHEAEKDFLNDVFVKAQQRVLVLRDKNPYSKEKVFEDLLDYYQDEGFQKDYECKLALFAKKYLDFLLKQALGDGKIRSIKFYTAVGTVIDFSFGVDAWVEIEDISREKTKICFDMKTGNGNKAQSSFADLKLFVEEKNGSVDPTDKKNQINIKAFIEKVAEIYLKKISEKKEKKGKR